MLIVSPIGDIRVFIDGKTVTQVLLPGWESDKQPVETQDREFSRQVEKAFYAYFDAANAKKTKLAYKQLTTLCIPQGYKFDAPKFHQKVYGVLLNDVPTGTTITYGELAELAGNPNAARAVGTAMRKNSLPILVPCHRVLPATGGIGQYMGEAQNGIQMKRWLLRHEGVNLRNF